MTPQVRARKRLRDEGFHVETVEQRVPGLRHVTRDFFGAFDLFGVSESGAVRCVQVTSRSNVAARVKKIAALPEVDRLRRAGFELLVWGWGKTKTKGDWLEVDVS